MRNPFHAQVIETENGYLVTGGPRLDRCESAPISDGYVAHDMGEVVDALNALREAHDYAKR